MENKYGDHRFTCFFNYQPIQNNNISATQNPNLRDAPNLCPSIPINLNRSEFPRINNTPTMYHMDSIVFSILDEQKLKNMCMDNHGTQVIQKMLEKIHYPLAISPILYTRVVYTMSRIAVELIKDINGGYVIVQCMKLFSPIAQKIILDELATNCIEISTDQIGSSVIQKCLSHAEEGAKIQLVTKIISIAIVLADHPFGNYVLQYLIKLKLSSINEMVIGNLIGTYVQLSMNKYASNVVEILLQLSRQDAAAIIVKEIMESNTFLSVLQDPFGNYVAQTALKCTKGRLHRELSDKIKANHENLQNHLYGKKVLAKADAKWNWFLNGS